MHHAGQIERAPADFPTQQVQLVLADLLRAQHFRRAAEVLGEASDLMDVGLDRIRGPIANYRVKPIYVDLGLILTHPETSKRQIFSFGRYYSESLLRKYRAEIVAGYFDHPGNETLIRIYRAIQVLNKWLMYEELMSRYKGIKRLLTIPTAPHVSAYFKRLLKKHLELIEGTPSCQAYGVETTTKTSV